MSALADRIRGITAPGARTPMAPCDVSAADAPPRQLAEILGGEWRAGEPGPSFVIDNRVSPDARYGQSTIGAIGEALESAAISAPIVGGGSAARPPFVFFDLETTGLNGGAGTYAFLVGCAAFGEDGAFAISQFLLTRFADERALLDGVRGALARAGALVSFNGKSFDAPLLETRYLFHRLQGIQGLRPHVDMLHPARRFWAGGRAAVEPACSLAALERQVLRVRRAGDVPGYEIPARYFHFVRTGDARPLGAVLEHNRRDLLSLAALTARLFSLVRAGADAASTAREALALGSVYADADLRDRAVDAYIRAMTMIEGETDEREWGGESLAVMKLSALRALAVLCRRSRRYTDAAEYWQQLLAIDDCPAHLSREATEALAIHHEHRLRDLEAAKTFALLSLDAGRGPGRAAAARHRLARIDRKLRVSEPRLALLS